MPFAGYLSLALSLVGCTSVVGQPAFTTVESPNVARRSVTAQYAVTLHVILQEHENPVEEARAKQDLQRVALCQANVVQWASKIAASGARAIVVEGLFANGSFTKPEPITVTEISEEERAKAKWLLAQRADLAVYGFELRALNEFGIDVIGQMGNSIAAAEEITQSAGGVLSIEAQQKYDRLLQEEFNRLTLWYAGVIPERSFLALQTALAVALSRGDKEVQLVIGKQHWGDLVYAASRHADVRLRLIPYSCD